MRKVFLAILVAIAVFASTEVDATVYYLKPAYLGGSDDSTGTSASTAWATLNRVADTTLAAGDSVIIYGGLYHDQYFAPEDSLKGTSFSVPITFKANGDSIAVFVSTGATGTRFFFDLAHGDDYIKIDGIGKHHYPATGDSLCIKFIWDEDDEGAVAAAIRFTGDLTVPTSRAVGNQVIGVEINGYATGRYPTTPTGYDNGLIFWKSDSANVTSCKIQYVGLLESDPYHSVSDGYGIEVNGRFNIVSKCTISYAGVAAVTVMDFCYSKGASSCTSSLGTSMYNQVKKCSINNHWGSGIYIEDGSRYTLVDLNFIYNCGSASNYAYLPAGIKLQGSRNTIRRNVLWNPEGTALVLKNAMDTYSYFHQNIDSNLVYSNVFFKSGRIANLYFEPDNETATGADTSATMGSNRFWNNNFYNALAGFPEVYFNLYYASLSKNWTSPDLLSYTPATTHFNNNSFHYNNFYTSSNYPMIVTKDAIFGHSNIFYTIPVIEVADTIWSCNEVFDPAFTSSSPDTASAPANWYTLTSSSQLIESGVFRYDDIAALARAKNIGRAWTDAWYVGSYPDIGIEYIAVPPAICSLSKDIFNFEAEVGDSISDTLMVYNTAPAGSDSIHLAVTAPTSWSDHFTITGGTTVIGPVDSTEVIFKFKPLWSTNSGYPDREISEDSVGTRAICPTISMSILSKDYTACCDLYPSATMEFGMKGVGVYYYDTLYIGNCSDSTLTTTVSLAVGTSYTLTAGSGVHHLLSGESDMIIVRFKPTTYASYPDTINISNVACGDVILSGYGVTPDYERE